MHGLDVIGKVLGAFRKVGQVPVGQLDHPALHVFAGQLDEVVGNRISYTPAARVQHHPHLIGFIQANLNEVVATTQGAHLVGPLGELAKGFQ